MLGYTLLLNSSTPAQTIILLCTKVFFFYLNLTFILDTEFFHQLTYKTYKP